MPVTIPDRGTIEIGGVSEERIASDEIFIPERHHSEWGIAFAVFLLSLLYLLLFRRYTWIDPDEGIILQGAQRILDGQVLYRDFFSFFTPGSYYLLALCFGTFGDSIIVAHTVLAFMGAACTPITYLLARRVCSRSTSLLVSGLVLMTAFPMRFVVVHNWDSTFIACLAVYCAVRLVESAHSGWAFASGSLVCITALFEQSKGGGLFLGLCAAFLVIPLRERNNRFLNRQQILSFTIGLVWPLLSTVAYFAIHHSVGAMISGWLWPLRNYTVANQVPYGYDSLTEKAKQMIFQDGSAGQRLLKILVFSPAVWMSLLPLLAVALLVRLAFLPRREDLTSVDWRYYVVLCSAISGLLLSVIAVRADYVHFAYLQPIFLLVMAWMMDGKSIRSRVVGRVSLVLASVMAMTLFLMGASLLFRTSGEHTIATRRGTLTSREKDEVIDFIQAHVPSGDRLLVYPYESSYYYLTQTYSPGRYEYYQPGMHTAQQVQGMLGELSRDPVKFVLYDRAFAEHARASWPNTPASAFTQEPIADYILREYRSCRPLRSAIGWEFQVMVRKDLACP